MKIRMLTTENGSVDGIRSAAYTAGVEYDLSASPGERDLAAAFVAANMAVAVGSAATVAAPVVEPVVVAPTPVAIEQPAAAPVEVQRHQRKKK